MSHKSEQLRKKEKMEVTLPTLIEYYVTSKQVKGHSKKTLVGFRSNLGKFVHYLQQQGHSLKVSEFSIQRARTIFRTAASRI